MGIEVERAAEALDEAHRASLAVEDAECPAVLALPGEDGMQESAEELAEEHSFHGQAEAQRP